MLPLTVNLIVGRSHHPRTWSELLHHTALPLQCLAQMVPHSLGYSHSCQCPWCARIKLWSIRPDRAALYTWLTTAPAHVPVSGTFSSQQR